MRLILFVLVVFFNVFSYAQGIQGVILGSNNQPLEGATITSIKKSSHAHSGENGHFYLGESSLGDSIRITHVSYASTIVLVDKDSLRIILEPISFQLENVTIEASAKHLNIISNIDLQTNPVNSSQELLRKVPGLFIGQHAGGGKAEQIFLRGFDIDHGTDISISVDGMPVNMVSHAHGQGYADLHFIIPETVDKIDFDKGPYYADKGNLATAGYVAFKTKEKLENSTVNLELGKFNAMRTSALFNMLNNEKQSAWVAAEYLLTDGYFESPQNFNRLNLMGKYTSYLPHNDKLSVSFSFLNSKWDASGQIPQRAVDQGLITRFGAIDDTEGGNTSRTNLNLQFYKQLGAGTFVKNSVYLSKYDFELYSNFTFFLNDPVNGDQIRQKEKRTTTGFESEFNKSIYQGNISIAMRTAIGLRFDDVNDIELSHTANRQTVLERHQLGNINESNLYSYVDADLTAGNWVINPGLRFDYFKFDYADKLTGSYQTLSQNKTIVSPKLNILYSVHPQLQFFLKLGKGFHSNDARVVVARNGKEILPAAYGADLGLTWKPLPRLVINSALWHLYLQQEFVYVGDEGVVEPSGRTLRKGIDLGLRYQFGRYLFFNSDFTYTHTRSKDEPKGNNYIPLAPVLTFAGGISLKHPSGWNAGIKSRILGNRPANEDNSIVAKGYTVTDLNLNYQWKRVGVGVITENIFNTSWNETQFATESRLKNEPASVTEIHFTPGTPFNVRAVLNWRF